MLAMKKDASTGGYRAALTVGIAARGTGT